MCYIKYLGLVDSGETMVSAISNSMMVGLLSSPIFKLVPNEIAMHGRQQKRIP